MNEKQFFELMDQISEIIRAYEKKMKELHLIVPVLLHNVLRWEQIGDGFRITLDHKPLIDCVFKYRAMWFQMLPELFDSAKEGMFEEFKNVNQENIDKVKDHLLCGNRSD